MKKLNMTRIMALGLSACLMASAAFAQLEIVGDQICNFDLTVKVLNIMTESATTQTIQGYLVFDEDARCVAEVFYRRVGREKQYICRAEDWGGLDKASLQKGMEEEEEEEEDFELPYELWFSEKPQKRSSVLVIDGLDSGFMAMAGNGIGTHRFNRKDGQLSSVNVTGTVCHPYAMNGTFKLRLNRSLTKKAAINGKSGLEQIIEDLERKGYEPAALVE